MQDGYDAINTQDFNIGLHELCYKFGEVKQMNHCLAGACHGGHLDTVKEILQCENPPTNCNMGLLYASKNGFLSIVKLMIEHKADNLDGALWNACLYGHKEVAMYLVEIGAKKFEQCLYSAISANQLEIVKWLLDSKLAQTVDAGLLHACNVRKIAIIRLLFTYKPTNIKECRDQMLKLKHGDYAKIALLLEKELTNALWNNSV